ncbi:DUF2835 domain-containing protein [Gilvimarinus japonicus]|jgi:hypothetical protein|uniref:DUF2835 domain-containing protein n=1 Tax=Gilvimarinus japonicus TaxID=1796469 RepID=A0ABV7HUN8_9GAMM
MTRTQLNQLEFSLDISAAQLERYYRGRVREVLAHTIDGRRVRFPLSLLRPFVSHSGVQGWFRIVFDQSMRCERLEKIDVGR